MAGQHRTDFTPEEGSVDPGNGGRKAASDISSDCGDQENLRANGHVASAGIADDSGGVGPVSLSLR